MTDKKDIQRFAIILFCISLFMIALSLLKDKKITISIFLFISILSISLFLFPNRLRYIYIGWIWLTQKIQFLFTIIMLTLAYYLVITPAGILKRIISGSPILMRQDRNAKSYWVEREECLQSKERFKKRY